MVFHLTFDSIFIGPTPPTERGRTVRPAEDDAAVELARETPFTSSAVDRVQRSAQVLKNALLIENDLKRCSFSLMY